MTALAAARAGVGVSPISVATQDGGNPNTTHMPEVLHDPPSVTSIIVENNRGLLEVTLPCCCRTTTYPPDSTRKIWVDSVPDQGTKTNIAWWPDPDVVHRPPTRDRREANCDCRR